MALIKRTYLVLLTVALVCLFAPVHGRRRALNRCYGRELKRSSSQIMQMYALSKALHARKASVGDIKSWIRLRSGLKQQLSTYRCAQRKPEKFCCHVCVSGKLSMFCSYKVLLFESYSALQARKERRARKAHRAHKGSRARKGRQRRRSSYWGRREVVIDLFSKTCDKPMVEQICSEFCCDPWMKRKFWQSSEQAEEVMVKC